MSTVALQDQKDALPSLPSELHALITPHGTITFTAVQHVAHGVKVSMKTEVSGSGGGWWFAGTGGSSMSVSSETQAIREFWITPASGGKEQYFEIVDSDFRVADGQTILGVYAQVGNNPPDLFAMVNLNAGTAMKVDGTAASTLHEKYSAQLLGKQNNWVALFACLVLGLAGWIWYKTNWVIGVPVGIGLLLAADQIIRKVPAFSRVMLNEENRKKVEKQIKERMYLCLKSIDGAHNPQWV